MKPIFHPNVLDVDLATILHAIADPTRLKLLCVIAEHDRSVKTRELASYAPVSSVHDQLAVLRHAGLIRTTKIKASLGHSSRVIEHRGPVRAVLDTIISALTPADDAVCSPDRCEAEIEWAKAARL